MLLSSTYSAFLGTNAVPSFLQEGTTEVLNYGLQSSRFGKSFSPSCEGLETKNMVFNLSKQSKPPLNGVSHSVELEKGHQPKPSRSEGGSSIIIIMILKLTIGFLSFCF